MTNLLERINNEEKNVLLNVLPKKPIMWKTSDTFLRPESFGSIFDVDAQPFSMLYFNESKTLLRVNKDLTNSTYSFVPLTNTLKIMRTKYFIVPPVLNGCIFMRMVKSGEQLVVFVKIPRQNDYYKIFYDCTSYKFLSFTRIHRNQIHYALKDNNFYVDDDGSFIYNIVNQSGLKAELDIKLTKVISFTSDHNNFSRYLACAECADKEHIVFMLNLSTRKTQVLIKMYAKIHIAFTVPNSLIIVSDNIVVIKGLP